MRWLTRASGLAKEVIQISFHNIPPSRLAIVGSVILIVMFVFSFLCPIFYGWGQTEVDYKYDHINKNYALAKENSEYLSYPVEGSEVDQNVVNRMNTFISEMKKNDATTMPVLEGDTLYTVDYLADHIYTLTRHDETMVAKFGSFQHDVVILRRDHHGLPAPSLNTAVRPTSSRRATRRRPSMFTSTLPTPSAMSTALRQIKNSKRPRRALPTRARMSSPLKMPSMFSAGTTACTPLRR